MTIYNSYKTVVSETRHIHQQLSQRRSHSSRFNKHAQVSTVQHDSKRNGRHADCSLSSARLPTSNQSAWCPLRSSEKTRGHILSQNTYYALFRCILCIKKRKYKNRITDMTVVGIAICCCQNIKYIRSGTCIKRLVSNVVSHERWSFMKGE